MSSKGKIDCERFYRGAEEVNRKRIVIKRVLTTLESLLVKTNNSRKKDRITVATDTFFFRVLFESGEWVVRIFLLDGSKTHWWTSRLNVAEIPAEFVQVVYVNLSKLLERLDEDLPECGIYQHFDFFSQQADI